MDLRLRLEKSQRQPIARMGFFTGVAVTIDLLDKGVKRI
jgi:hypothetical protein